MDIKKRQLEIDLNPETMTPCRVIIVDICVCVLVYIKKDINIYNQI